SMFFVYEIRKSFKRCSFLLLLVRNYFSQKAGRIILICLSARPSSHAALTLAFRALPCRLDCRSANQIFSNCPFWKKE
ncbi:MAG: hypothetical protein IJT08_01695, partial [Alphaproteobacteria bacterium]|nr:hypothetical protein [Alphaproteobacteria bacterium]